jgi:hypothetical protein
MFETFSLIGDVVASSYGSKIFMMLMIIVALVVVPLQVSRVHNDKPLNTFWSNFVFSH